MLKFATCWAKAAEAMIQMTTAKMLPGLTQWETAFHVRGRQVRQRDDQTERRDAEKAVTVVIEDIHFQVFHGKTNSLSAPARTPADNPALRQRHGHPEESSGVS
ncbi:hypothetical protein ACH492_39670 [Streptomyces sp. NPDC019443]|uniref:hypothetical protein n=1 Tax=Streptomyces sp. NPDC019443 TaxID=3365061 RepID=UPI0037988356